MALPDGRRGPSHVRPDRALGAARQVRDVDAPADRRLRDDHRLELSRSRCRRGRSCRRWCAATRSCSSPPRKRRPRPSTSCRRWSTPALPAGVLNLVLGDGPGAGAPLRGASRRAASISFTGSTETGRLVNQACAPTFKKVHLEMGGKNVILVMDDANLELAVDGALWGGFGTTGQRCTAASRVVVHEKVLQGVPRGVRGTRQDAASRRRPGSGDADGAQRQRGAACSA